MAYTVLTVLGIIGMNVAMVVMNLEEDQTKGNSNELIQTSTSMGET